MSRHLTQLLAACLLAGASLSASAASFTTSGNDTVAKTLAPASGGSETGTVTAAGDLNLGTNAVAVTVTGGSGTRTAIVNNSGKIRQTATGATAARAIRNSSGAATINVTNNAGALIQAADADAIQISVAGSSVVLDNSGSIIVAPNTSAGGNQAIDWNGITTAGNSLFNRFGGLISATSADGVRPGVNGVIDNAGTIRAIPLLETPSAGVTQASSSDGIDAQTNSGISVSNSGSVFGRHAITGGATATADFTISVTNQNGGTISGVNGAGINIDNNSARLGNATVVNYGTITGNFDATQYNTGDGDGVDVDGICTLTNSGIIRGLGASGNGSDGGGNNPEGVSIGGGTVINNAGAEITGQETTGSGRKGHGLLVDNSSGGNGYGPTSISNAGLIRGYDSYAIRIVGTFANSIVNDSSGSIRGGGNAAEGAAIQTTAGIDTLTNRGAIVGDNGLAVDLGDGNDVMHILGGSASITGDVSGGVGSNTLDIDPGSAGAMFSYGGVLSNFATVAINSGTVALSGASSYVGDTTVSNAGLLVGNTSGSATGTGTVIVNGGAVLLGEGSVAAASIRSGGHLRPGAGAGAVAGTLSISGDLTLTDGSQIDLEVGAPTDLVNVGGSLHVVGGGQAVINITSLSLVPGTDYTLIRFASTDATTASFTLGTVPASLGATLELTGNALLLHSPAASLNSTMLSFAQQITSTVSSEQSLTITNSGTAPLLIGTPVITGADASSFQFGLNGCTSPLAPSDSCSIGIRFAPTSANDKLASLSIPSNASSSPDTVSLSGTAIDALYRLEASPASISFGNQPVGSSGAPSAVLIRNTGNSPITVSGFSASGAQATEFSITADHCSGQPLAANDSCSVSFVFSPTAAGSRSAVETVLSSPAQSNGLSTISLSGNGTQAGIQLAPGNLDFGSLQLGSSSLPQPVILNNTGNAALTLTSIGVSSNDFSQTNTCGTVIAAGGSCEIDVRFAPKQGGNTTITGSLSVFSSAPDGPSMVGLSGIGVTPPAGTLGLVSANATVEEAQGQTLMFTVARSGGSYGAVTLHYASADGSAVAGRDYTTVSGTLSWADGDTASKAIAVPVLDNRRGDGTRSFTLTLSSPTGNSSLGTSTGTGTISDDDRSGVLRFDLGQVKVSDSAGSVSMVVHRDRGAGHAASVHYASHNLTALAGTHYTAVAGELNWAAGDWSDRTITVPVTAGALSKGQRSFTVQLSAPTGGARLGSPSLKSVLIQYGP